MACVQDVRHLEQIHYTKRLKTRPLYEIIIEISSSGSVKFSFFSLFLFNFILYAILFLKLAVELQDNAVSICGDSENSL